MAKSHLKLVTPATVKRTVTPRRRRNGDLRTREYLTEHEVERLIAAAKRNRVAVAVAVGSGRLQNRDPARPQSQGRHPQHPSHPRR